MIRLSASLIKDILSCSQRGYYRINHPELGIDSPEMRLGNAVHYAIEQEWDDEAEARKLAHSNALSFEIDPEPALKLTSNFFQHFRFLCQPDDLVEQRFELKLYDNVVLVGKLDRVNVNDGLVFDWKTTKNPPSFVDGDIQFILYHYAFTRLYGVEPSSVFYASLTKGKLIRYNKDELYYRTLFGSIIPRVLDTIYYNNHSKDGLFDYFVPKYEGSSTCFYCPFKSSCLGELGEE